MQVGALEIGSREVGSTEIRGMEINIGEVHTRKIGAGELRVCEVEGVAIVGTPPIPASDGIGAATKKLQCALSLQGASTAAGGYDVQRPATALNESDPPQKYAAGQPPRPTDAAC